MPRGSKKTGVSKPAAKADFNGKRPTINDIARLTGVSKKTVSRVINESPLVHQETREKVKLIIAKYGFTPDPMARGLASRKSFLVGMIYDNPSPQYIIDLQRGILDALATTGLQLVLRPADRAHPEFLTEMRSFVERQKLFGAVLPPSISEDERLAALLRELECPYVRIASVSLDEPGVMLVTNDHIGGREAAQHLADLGHKTIGHISGPLSFRSAHERRRGFIQELSGRGIDVPAKYIAEGSYTFESGYACATRLLALKPRPTAIFAGNDEMAAGVYRAARDANVELPRDLSVVGYDDSALSTRVWPTMTTVHVPIRSVGSMAASRLVRPTTHHSTEVVPNLVVRASTAPPLG